MGLLRVSWETSSSFQIARRGFSDGMISLRTLGLTFVSLLSVSRVGDPVYGESCIGL
jgi:hypothetical protein